MKLSIICPCYNEANTCLKVVEDLIRQDIGIDKEILVVDDGSTDGSDNILSNIEGIKYIRHDNNMGKGAAFRTGVTYATGDLVVPFDLDGEYDTTDLTACLQPILSNQAKVVYGSRRLNKNNNQYSGISFYIGGVLLTSVTNILFFSKLTDEPTCLKMMYKDIVDTVKIDSPGFEWEPELTAKILKRKIKIIEVPINYYPRDKKAGKKIKWKDGFIGVWTLLKYRW